MQTLRRTIVARPVLTLGLAVVVLGTVLVEPLAAAGGNFVSVAEGRGGSCWRDLHIQTGNGSDRKEEQAAAANTFGTWDVRSEGAVHKLPQCQAWWQAGPPVEDGLL